jgi:hypothetical protein
MSSLPFHRLSKREDPHDTISRRNIDLGQRAQRCCEHVEARYTREPENSMTVVSTSDYRHVLRPDLCPQLFARDEQTEATRLLQSVPHLEYLLSDIDRIERTRGTELASIAAELSRLKTIVSAHIAGRGTSITTVRLAVEALVYLRDSFDALLDQHIGLGFEDDCDHIRQVDGLLAS